MPAPTLISYTETASWTTSATTKSTASVSWQAGDVLVVLGLNEGSSNLNLPTATGVTFLSRQAVTGSSRCSAQLAAVVAAGGGSSAVTMTQTASVNYGFGVWVLRASNGIGNSVQQATTAKTVALTPTAADGLLIWGAADFAAGTVFTAGTPTPTDTRQLFQGTQYSAGVFDLIDQVGSGAVSYGFTGGGTTGPFTIVALEVQAGTGGGTTFLAAPNQPIVQAVKRASYW